MDGWLFLALGLSLLFSAFFSGMEIAFISANKLKIELDKKQGNLSAVFYSRIIGNKNSVYNQSNFIGAMLLGNNIALVVYGIIMAWLLEPMIVRYITGNAAIILVIQTIVSTLIILVTAEFLPKAVFRINPNRALKIFTIPVFMLYHLLLVIVLITIGISNLFIRLFFGTGTFRQQPAFGRVDLDEYVKSATKRAEEQEEVDHDIQIFQNALDFSKIKARECMIPRTEIVALEVDDEVDKLRQRFIDTGLSKILIYRGTIDNIIGYTHSYELFKNPESIKSILLPISVIPETMPANEVLELFIQQRRSIAVVVDEFGGTSGMLTIEDVVEEIFGDIEDEHDREVLVEQRVSDTEYELSARLEIDYLNEKFKLGLPESEEYETLAGLIISEYESIPQEGERIDTDAFLFEIKKVSDNRIELVRLVVKEEE